VKEDLLFIWLIEKLGDINYNIKVKDDDGDFKEIDD
jgi:hypothetical protein